MPATRQRSFLAGLRVARHHSGPASPPGAPLPTIGGNVVVTTGEGPLTLLSWVDGRELVGDTAVEQQLIGSTLALVHRALATADVPDTER
ncbi:hypothetical protein K1W54_21100 [Micromonospora sp. CPCC 205371]|nr:hypothetical protein [Micromonospora sp. CPCC 205371]